MKYLKRIGALLIAGLLLCGCTGNPGQAEETPVSSYIWETMPALEYGSLEYERLEVQSWYSGRCEATGKGKWAETESGYYYLYDEILYYADKADLSTWVPVCDQPNCSHKKYGPASEIVCNAQITWGVFLMVDGRLYTVEESDTNTELKLDKGRCTVLCSRAPDGTDLRREYYVEGTVDNGGGNGSVMLSYQSWLQCWSVLNPDGSYTQKLYCTTKDGDHLLAEYTTEDSVSMMVHPFGVIDAAVIGSPGQTMMIQGPNGDEIFFTTVFGDEMRVAYRFRNGQLETLDIMDYATQWKYLSGDTLRIFRSEDGIYDVNIQTKQEIKVEDCAGKSRMVVRLPNCIIAYGTDGAMQLFDGNQWRDIRLPQSLEDRSAGIACVASDRIIFLNNDDNGSNIYQVMLDQKELTMEYCGTIQKLP